MVVLAALTRCHRADRLAVTVGLEIGAPVGCFFCHRVNLLVFLDAHVGRAPDQGGGKERGEVKEVSYGQPRCFTQR